MKGALLLFILIISSLVAGCAVQPEEQTPGTELAPTTKTNELSSGDITYTDDNERWPIYTNSYDRYKIYYPNTWIAAPLDSPYREPETDRFGTISPIRKQVYIYPPMEEGRYLTSGNGMVLVTGYTISNPNSSYTTKQMNDEFFQHFAGQMESENDVMNVKVDNNEYLINGNPARHMTFESRGGQNTYEYFQIVHDYTFYSLQWAGNKSYVSTASKIMRTFATY